MPDPPQRWSLLLLVAICIPVFLAGLGSPSLWEPDEPRFAEASREMLNRGDYMTPWFNDVTRFEKPIMLYWMQLVFYALLGVNELAARLPVALCGVGSVLLVYLLGIRVVGQGAGLIGAVAFATMFRVVVYARHGLTDMPLLFFLLAAMYFFQRTMEGPDDARVRRFALLAWAGLGLAMITKGPVALVMLPVWVGYLLLSGQRWGLQRMHALPGTALFALISFPWYGYMVRVHGREYLDLALFGELVDRVVEKEFQGETRGFFYFFKVWPADIAPWTLFFLAAVIALLVSWKTLQAETKRGVLLLLTWFVVIQIVFSLASGKLPHYIIPSYPAAALLIGLAFTRAAEPSSAAPRTAMAVASWATAVLCAITAALTGAFLYRVFEAPFVSVSSLIPLGLIGGALLAMVWQWRGRPLHVFAGFAATFVVVYTVLAVDTVPRYLEPFKPIRSLSAIVVEQMQPGDRVCAFTNIDAQSFVFYTRATVEKPLTPGAVRVMLAEPERVFCLMRSGDLEAVRRGLPFPIYVLGESPMFFVRLSHLWDEDPQTDRRRALIVSNRPAQ